MNYYLIPITERQIAINNECLLDHLKEIKPELYEREIQRVKLLYVGGLNHEYTYKELCNYRKFNRDTLNIYDKEMIPNNIVAVGDDNVAYEILTNNKIVSYYPAALGVRKISKMEAENYLFENSKLYESCVNNYFCLINKNKENKIYNFLTRKKGR